MTMAMRRAKRNAAVNSNRGIDISFKGATLVLLTTNLEAFTELL